MQRRVCPLGGIKGRRHWTLTLGTLSLVAVVAGASTPAPREVPVVQPRGTAILRAETAALVLSGQTGGVLRVEVLPLPHPPHLAEDATVTVLVDVVGDTLAAGMVGVVAVEVFVYAFAGEDDVRAQVSRRVEVDLARAGEALAAGGLRLALPLKLEGGEHEVRALVRRGDGALGLQRAPVVVGGDPLAVVLLEAGLRVAPLAGEPDVWALLPELVAATADETRAWPAPAATPATPMASPEDALAQTAERGSRPPRPELMSAYLLALGRQAAGDGDAALRRLYELEGRVAGARMELPALEHLARVEAATVHELLRRGGQRAAAAAARRRAAPRLLLPIALLHADAAEGYRSVERYRLATHSEEVVLRLVWLAVKETERSTGKRSDSARQTAARLLGGMAVRILQWGQVGPAEGVLRHALDFHDGDPAVLLALAAIEHRRGRPAAAVRLLDRLASVAPGHREANLLRAICKLQSGDVPAAASLLAELCDGRGWTAVLACEEQARLVMERGDHAAALELADESLGRWPGHPTLAVQRAYLLDRLRRGAEALEQLRAADRGAANAADERLRFNDWPIADLEAGFADARKEAEEVLEDLALAVTALRREVER